MPHNILYNGQYEKYKIDREGFKKKLVEFSTKRGEGGFGSDDFPLKTKIAF